MVTTKIEALAAAQARVAELEKAVARELSRDLAALPARYGFESVGAFIAAAKAACGKRRGRKAASALSTTPKRRKRAKITNTTRAKVKKLVEAGKTGGQIAKAAGISLPSVQNIKKALGITRPRGSKSK